MADKKKQHYVPKFYMRRFLCDPNRYYLFNIEKNKNYGPVPYKDQCYEDYFYGKDKIWEDKLSIKERNWENAFNRFISGDYSSDVITLLKEFAIFQKGRTVDQVEKQIDINAEMVFQQMKMIIDHDKTINDKEKYYVEAKNRALESTKQNMTPNALLDIFEKIVDTIEDLSFTHLQFQTKEKLISSDNPIIMLNTFTNNVGFGNIGLIIMFPISPNDLIIFYDDKIYCKLRNHQNIKIKNEYVTKKINKMVFCNSNNLVYSPVDFKKYLFDDELFNWWKKNQDIKCVSTASTKNDAIVAVHYPNLQYTNDLYLFDIESKFDAVNNDFRTPVPRKFDVGFKEKLKREMTDIPKILSRSKDDIIDDAYIYNYEKGHKKYYELMMEYWGEA